MKKHLKAKITNKKSQFKLVFFIAYLSAVLAANIDTSFYGFVFLKR